MSLTVSEILRHPNVHDEVRRHARALLDINLAYPRLASVFATEQRSMMGNIAFRMYFASAAELPRRGFVLARFLDAVEESGVASRNTADGFIKEMLKYGYVAPFEVPGDKRLRPLEPTEATMAGFIGWAVAHLDTLDRLDGGSRVATVTQNLGHVADLHLQLSDDLIGDGAEAVYPPTLELFAWVNNSKLLTARLLGGMGDVEAGASRVSTDIDSIAELAGWLGISQTHLTRKMRETEAMGSLGWEGRRGSSPMWMSTGFLKEMMDECAARIAIFDTAYESFVGSSVAAKKRG